MADTGGTPGAGYSLIVVNGTFTVTATSAPGSQFTVALTSLDPSSHNPGLASFNATLPSSMTILQATSISGFNMADFTVNTGAFQNSLMGGTFAVDQSGNTLTLDFTPVPEPSTWALLLGGATLVTFRLRRRSRA